MSGVVGMAEIESDRHNHAEEIDRFSGGEGA